MTLSWTGEGADFHAAEYHLGAGVVVHLLVERLGDLGWSWQVWDPARHLRMDGGVTQTLEAAKVWAELALTEAVACAEVMVSEVFERLRSAA